MSQTYGNPHLLPPTQCSSNYPGSGLTNWTDPTITPHSTKRKTEHISELRTQVLAELTRRGITGYSGSSFTDPTLTAHSTKLRVVHITDLRNMLVKIKQGDCAADSYYCPQDSSGCMDFTDASLTAHSTKTRAVHLTDLRTKLKNLQTSCICEIEQCNYCSDCGYQLYNCSNNGVSCNNSQGGESCGDTHVVTYCASSDAGGTNPYIVWTGTCSCDTNRSGRGCIEYDGNTCVFGGTKTAWTGYVPWAMANSAPPGSNWCTYCAYNLYDSDVQNWTAHWTCKCNPFIHALTGYCDR